MKTLKLIVFGMILMFAASAQGQVSVRLNIGTPPHWGPSGYSDVRYYYLPDIECYYDVPNSMFIYFSGNRWIHSRYLPTRYRDYDLYNGYKVVMNDYRGNTPYIHHREYRMKYARGYRGHEQHNIGERHDSRDRGHEVYRDSRSNHDSYRAPVRSQQVQVRGNERVQTLPNNRVQSYDNGKGHDNRSDKGQSHGNDKEKNNGHDNGKK